MLQYVSVGFVVGLMLRCNVLNKCKWSEQGFDQHSHDPLIAVLDSQDRIWQKLVNFLVVHIGIRFP